MNDLRLVSDIVKTEVPKSKNVQKIKIGFIKQFCFMFEMEKLIRFAKLSIDLHQKRKINENNSIRQQ